MILAFLLSSSAKLRILIILTVVNADSADEKYADSRIHRIKIIICII